MIIDNSLQERLRQLGENPQIYSLVEYLKLAKQDLNNVTTAKSWEETLGRKDAIKIIDDLFSFLEKKKVETRDKNQYT